MIWLSDASPVIHCEACLHNCDGHACISVVQIINHFASQVLNLVVLINYAFILTVVSGVAPYLCMSVTMFRGKPSTANHGVIYPLAGRVADMEGCL